MLKQKKTELNIISYDITIHLSKRKIALKKPPEPQIAVCYFTFNT